VHKPALYARVASVNKNIQFDIEFLLSAFSCVIQLDSFRMGLERKITTNGNYPH